MPDTFASRLLAARKQAGLTIRELARRVNLSRQQIGSYESGRQVNPSYATVVALAAALGCSPLDLFPVAGPSV